MYTIIGQDFAKWVQLGINRRNEINELGTEHLIELNPMIAKAFFNSNSISSKYYYKRRGPFL